MIQVLTDIFWFLMFAWAIAGAIDWTDYIVRDLDIDKASFASLCLLGPCPFVWAAIIVFFFN